MKFAIGVDIGGTKIDFILIDVDGHILKEYRTPTAPHDGIDAVIDRIVEGIHHLTLGQITDFVGIGIGCPGHVDANTGVVRTAVNLGWQSVALLAKLQERLTFNMPIFLQNDVNAAALSEFYFGAAQAVDAFAYIAIGTGLGAAAIINGKLISGANAFAMELGHLVLEPNGRQCGCGLCGCTEMYISGIGLMAGLEAHRHKYPASTILQHAEPDTSVILKAARQGDALAECIIIEASDWLARLCAVCASTYNPSMIVIGGGLGSAAADLLIPIATAKLSKYVLPEAYQTLHIVAAQSERIAKGAATLAFLETGHKDIT